MCRSKMYNAPTYVLSLLPQLSIGSRIYCLTQRCEQSRIPITHRPLPLCALSSSKVVKMNAHVLFQSLPRKHLCALFFQNHTTRTECPVPNPAFTYYARNRDSEKSLLHVSCFSSKTPDQELDVSSQNMLWTMACALSSFEGQHILRCYVRSPESL
jgi:hypothetical protein